MQKAEKTFKQQVLFSDIPSEQERNTEKIENKESNKETFPTGYLEQEVKEKIQVLENNTEIIEEIQELKNKIEGIERIRFISPHPKDFTDDVIDAIANCEKVCKCVQSSSDQSSIGEKTSSFANVGLGLRSSLTLFFSKFVIVLFLLELSCFLVPSTRIISPCSAIFSLMNLLTG